MSERILKAFYHRGRRTFVCWTLEELSKRTSTAPDDLLPLLRGLAQKQFVRGLKGHVRDHVRGVDPTTWELTPAGKAQAAQIIHAEAMARSV